jgi:3-phosphoshikimate 1-carboxyvinyltransferase
LMKKLIVRLSDKQSILFRMNNLQLIPLPKPVKKEILLPGSLSYTIRALALAAMTKGTVTIDNPLKSDDTYAMLAALETLGIKNEEEENAFVVYGDISDVIDETYTINIRLSGRTARMLLAMLCIMPGTKTLTCSEPFKKRPMKDLVDGLRQLGAEITYLEAEGHLPVKITSAKLQPGTVTMDGSMSSQYFSAIMMIAPYVGDISIAVVGEQASKPFIDITTDAMEQFGVHVENDAYKQYRVANGQHYKKSSYSVEPDATAASYFWGIAAVTQSTITVQNISTKSKQGDVRFIEVLEKMGCFVRKSDNSITVEGPAELKAVTVDMNQLPDVVPTLAVVAAFAAGKTHITGLSHLKGKESDRIEAPKTELGKMGISAIATGDTLTITGGAPYGAVIETYDDHRIAMAFAVAGSRIQNIVINHSEVVSKSFPEFWGTIEVLGIQTKQL